MKLDDIRVSMRPIPARDMIALVAQNIQDGKMQLVGWDDEVGGNCATLLYQVPGRYLKNSFDIDTDALYGGGSRMCPRPLETEVMPVSQAVIDWVKRYMAAISSQQVVTYIPPDPAAGPRLLEEAIKGAST